MRDDMPGTGLGPLVSLVATVALSSWLAGRALAAGVALADSPGRAADVPDAVAVLLLWTGCAAAAWYALTCGLALVIRLGRAAGATTSGLERTVRRWGFPVLRRAVLTTVAAGAGLSLSVGAAGASTAGAEPGLPEDLGWGADVVSEQPAEVGAQLGEAARSSLPIAVEADGGAGAVPPLRRPSGAPGGSAATDDEVGGTAPAHDAVTTAEAAGEAARVALEAARTSHATGAVTSHATGAPGTGHPAGAPGTSLGEPTPRASSGPGIPESPPSPAAAARTPALADEHDSPSDAGTYRVRPGDSLWSVAAAHQGEHATTAEVAQAWPEWYRANRLQIGPNPHVIHPGQLLHVPDEEAS
ncbi:LysM peptidoglycan-binding domain-containing protein [Georgenia sp. EYE_87]|uniref:LysM peptidoglycan-binding domain-containing protein n=1 Tax=Georgenia sp. EYE_87 TaxID=2853448 RepID=UPI002004E5A9|nr:LysM domain-containing protein [Georgenia sp. EYE_87]MCK6212053.1 LysM peptidoglycan-binding domain-containing protein [Georgenia sp. EYE_87]